MSEEFSAACVIENAAIKFMKELFKAFRNHEIKYTVHDYGSHSNVNVAESAVNLRYVSKLHLTSIQPCFTATEIIQSHCTRAWSLCGHRAVSRAAFDGRQHTLGLTSRALCGNKKLS